MIASDGASRRSSVFAAKVSPRIAIVFPARSPPTARGDLLDHLPPPPLVHRHRGLDQRQRRPKTPPGRDELPRVLRQARSAIPRAGAQIFRPDPAIEPDAQRHLIDIAAGRIAEVRDLVDEA